MTRRTGKTFRNLLRALADASDGHNVYYIATEHARTKDFYFKHAVGFVTAYHGASATIKFSFLQKKIGFPNGGEITFVTSNFEEYRVGTIKKYYDV